MVTSARNGIGFQRAVEFKGYLAVAGMRRAETLADKLGLEYAGNFHVVFSDQYKFSHRRHTP